MAQLKALRKKPKCLTASAGPNPPANLSPGVTKPFFRVHILKREGSLDAAWGSVAAVSSMIELIAVAIGLGSVGIFLAHTVDAYRA